MSKSWFDVYWVDEDGNLFDAWQYAETKEQAIADFWRTSHDPKKKDWKVVSVGKGIWVDTSSVPGF